MNIERNDSRAVVVTLSRRNLEHLLQALDMHVGAPNLHRLTQGDIKLVVRAKENSEHYGDRTPGPGFDSVRTMPAVR